VLQHLVVSVHFVFHKYQFLYYVHEVSCGCNCRNLNLWNSVCTADSTNWLLSWNWL